MMTKRMQVKTIARNGVIFFIEKYTKNYPRMYAQDILIPYPALFGVKINS